MVKDSAFDYSYGQTRSSTRTHAVLVALDGSASSGTALTAGRLLAQQLNDSLHVVHALASERDQADAAEWLGPDGAAGNFQLITPVGEPSAQIVETANRDPDVELVVMAARGEHSRQSLASVTRSVIHEASRPIVLIRPDLVLESEHALRPIRRLLLPIDGTPTTARALRAVSDLAARLGAILDLLYVADGDDQDREPGCMASPCYVDQPHHEWSHWRGEIADRLLRVCARCPDQVPVEIFFAAGEPGPEIVRFAADHNEDAVVLVRQSSLEPGQANILRQLFADSPIATIFVVRPYQRTGTAA